MQFDRAIERREQLNLNLEEGAAPLEELRMKLEELLDRRMGVEDELKLARMALEDADRELREAERRRTQAEQQAITVAAYSTGTATHGVAGPDCAAQGID